MLKALQARMLLLLHYAEPFDHPKNRWLYHFLSRFFYWPHISLNRYIIVKSYIVSAKDRATLHRHNILVRKFPDLAPFMFVAADIFRKLFTSSHNNNYLLVNLGLFSKLTSTVPLRLITSKNVDKLLVTCSVLL